MWEGIKGTSAKILSVGATAILGYIGAQGYEYFLNQEPEILIQGLLLIAGYSVWTEVIVPGIEEFFGTYKPTTAIRGETKSKFKLI